MKGLDYSKFKRVSSTENATTLRHADGHELKIAHGPLSPKVRDQLTKLPVMEQKLAEGGEAKTEEANATDASSGKPVTININNGGAQPTPDAPSPTVAQRFGQAMAKTPVGMGVQALNAVPGAVNAAQPYLEQAVQGFRNGVAGEPLNPEAPAAPAAASQEAAPSAAPAAAPSATGAATPNPLTSQFDSLPKDVSLGKAYELGKAGIGMEQKAEQQKAEEAGRAAQTHEGNLRMQQQVFDGGVQELNQHVQDTIQDVKDGHINPNHFWESKSSIGKVSTAIGLILGGAGGGLTHQENPALKFLNQQVERDVDAQRSNIANRHTLLNAYMKQFDNLQVATNMTKATELGIYASQLEQAAAKAADPAAKARALQGYAQLMTQIAPLVQQAQVLRMAQGGGGQGGSGGQQQTDPAAFVPHLVPKDHQEATYKEIERAQDTRRMGKNIMDAFDKTAEENTVVRRAGGLRGDPGSLLALHQALQPTFKDLEGTVRQSAMDNTFKNVTPERGDTAHRIEEKRQALAEYLKSKASAPRAKSYGIDLERFGSTSSATSPAAQNSSAPREGATGTYQGKPVIFKGGQWTYRSQASK